MKPDELEQLLRKYNFQGITKRGHNLMACCPAHPERRPSWGISVNEPHMHGCFSCGFKGSLFTLLKHLGMSRSEALKYADDVERTNLADSLTLKSSSKLDELPMKYLYANPLPKELLRRVAKWRDVSRRTLLIAQCGYNERDNRFVFPWFYNKRLVGLTARTLDLHEPNKIISYGNVSAKGKSLYLPQGKISRDALVLVEGEFDALKVFDAGHKNVGALAFGNLAKRVCTQVIESAASQVLLFFDNDYTGKRLTREAQSSIGKYKSTVVLKYAGKDPGELTKCSINKVLKKSLTLSL